MRTGDIAEDMPLVQENPLKLSGLKSTLMNGVESSGRPKKSEGAMTEKHVNDLLLFIVALYGERFKLNAFTQRAWYLVIGHVESFDVAKAALIRCSQLSKWPPTPAELLEQVAEITSPYTHIDGAEAWGLVLKAARDFGARREKEALLSLPAHVRSVVKAFGWRELCLSENIDVIRGEFLKMYASFSARRQQQLALPPVDRKLTELANRTVKAIGE